MERAISCGNTSGGFFSGFTLGIRAPGQTFNQCMAANAHTYSAGGAAELAVNVATGTNTDITSNRAGHHIYVVSGGTTPRFAYTIGAGDSICVELILAGAVFYFADEVTQIINNIAARLRAERDQKLFELGSQGSFTLRRVHESWATKLMLGALDYYQTRDIFALQIVPDDTHWTVDIPDMSAPWDATAEPAWRWLQEPWTYPVPEDATATTNLRALRGERITEVMRWEEDEWEMFAGAGPDVQKEDLRVVPLGTLLGTDESLQPVMDLEIGTGLWRDAVSEWHQWGRHVAGP